MPTGYSRSPKLLKGALIEFSERFIGPIPNVIVFQYNPEMMTRTMVVWGQSGAGDTAGESSASNDTSNTAQPFDPPESFTLALELDAADALENPDKHPVAFISGVADRIAAMEMLLYPQSDSLLGGLLGSISGSLGGPTLPGALLGGGIIASRGTVPVVLFVWGKGRIVPVRLTTFSVEEQAYSPTLFPIRAKVNIGLKILTPKDFPCRDRKLSEELAIAAYKYTRKEKEKLAASYMGNNVESILGMMPF